MKHFDECLLKMIKICVEDCDESTVGELCSEMVSLLIVANLGDYNVLQQCLSFISKESVYQIEIVVKFTVFIIILKITKTLQKVSDY